jgi:hypothetical protein
MTAGPIEIDSQPSGLIAVWPNCANSATGEGIGFAVDSCQRSRYGCPDDQAQVAGQGRVDAELAGRRVVQAAAGRASPRLCRGPRARRAGAPGVAGWTVPCRSNSVAWPVSTTSPLESTTATGREARWSRLIVAGSRPAVIVTLPPGCLVRLAADVRVRHYVAPETLAPAGCSTGGTLDFARRLGIGGFTTFAAGGSGGEPRGPRRGKSAPSGTRTPNPLVKSQLLCQLS